jgi:tetratricopeptide (TPR) repeat protein
LKQSRQEFITMEHSNQRRTFIFVCLGLALITLAVYWPMMRDGFVNFDDRQYIAENPHVTSGITASNIAWAFKSGEQSNWHPLTWISHMLDCQMFGLNPAGHHFVNLFFHIANTLLLFLLLNRVTGATWRSAFVAALFAWHPMHVESVAWASERKDVLSAFFFLLTLLAWAQFSSKSKTQSANAKTFYVLALVFFACGLMSKPMLVTLPFVLLLMDFWPLQRVDGLTPRRIAQLVIEKIPFFVLSVVASVVTYLVQSKEAVSHPAFQTHIANIFVSYVRYIGKLIWPADLSVIYPLPRHIPMLPAIAAALLLLIVSILIIQQTRRHAYLFTGWFWFLGMLVPTIGIVQVGSAAMADRYTYLPGIGFFILIAWGISDLLNRMPQWKKFLPVAASIALVGSLGATPVQIGYWQNSLKLFYHAVEVTSDNYSAENSLGKAFEESGDNQRALICYSNSVVAEPKFPPSQYNLAVCLLSLGRTNEALEHFRICAQFPGHNAENNYALAVYLNRCGDVGEAGQLLQRAIDEQPEFPKAQNVLGTILSIQGKFAEALPHFAAAAKQKPNDAEFRFNYALSLLDNHKSADAAEQFQTVIKLTPNDVLAHFRLAQALAQQNRFSDAVKEYHAALQLAPQFSIAQKELDQLLSGHPELNSSDQGKK